MPKPIKKRVQKKVTDTEKEVKDRLINLKEAFKQRQKYILRYIILGLLLIIAISGYLFYDYSSGKKALALASEAYKSYYNIYQKQTLNRAEQLTKALELFKKSYNTKKSPVVLLYVGNCYYELGRYDEALKTLKDFLNIYSKEDKLVPLAYKKMSNIYLKKGDIKEAMKTLEILYNLKGYIYKDLALIEYARLLEKEGRIEEAKKKYKELTEKFSNSPFRSEAESKLFEKKEG
ncbi:MAG: tetratricopeptide repeat protein [Nitrospirae bacterium]|nr:tetratricopeptide repeat protein [Nitrospirota bacterium]